MLIRYRVENYRSFGDEQKLDMVAGQVRNHPTHIMESNGIQILSTAIVFGANASGKTNLVRSMQESRRMIVAGTGIGRSSFNRSRVNDDETEMAFEYVMSTNDVIYSYGFSISSSNGLITEEWLHRSKGADEMVFHRVGPHVETSLHMDDSSNNAFSVYRGEASNREELFLRALCRGETSKGDVFTAAKKVMEWFKKNLIVVGAGNPIPVRDKSKENTHVGKVVSTYNRGISGVRYEKIDPATSGIPRDYLEWMSDTSHGSAQLDSPIGRFRITQDDELSIEKMMFDHHGVPFDFTEESDGTRRLVDLAPVLNPDEGEDLTYVIDELDRSLHPQLSKKIMQDFLKISPVCNRQLIATVHESRLMDLGLLRRDEIWFVENGKGANTELFSLEDFNERGDRKVDKAYLNGRYGAVPCFKILFPDLE